MARSELFILAAIVFQASHASALTVTDMTPLPGSTQSSPPASIVVTFDQNPDPATVTTTTFRLVRAGPDATLGTADDVAITPAGVSVTGNQATMDLSGITLPDDQYRLILNGGTVPSSGLTGHWKFDEGSGTSAGDSVGGNTGTLFNGTTWAPGVRGQAVSFDGTNDQVQITRNAALEPASAITVSLWANITATPPAYCDLLRKSDETGQGYLLRWNHDGPGRLEWRIDRPGGPYIVVPDSQPTSARLNAWHLFTATYDGAAGVAKLYVDGVEQSSVSGVPLTLQHSADLYLMYVNYSGQKAVPGRLDDLRIYNRALTVQEVQSLFLESNRVTDLSGKALDGEFTGAFPSGNGTPGGDFVASFTLATPPLTVTALSPAPGSALATPPANITVNLSKDVDPATVNAGTVQLIGSGPDGSFGTSDDTAVVPGSVILATPSQVVVDLAGVTVPDDRYEVRLSGWPGAPSQGLAAYYAFEEGSGTATADFSGNGNSATLVDSVWQRGKQGSGLGLVENPPSRVEVNNAVLGNFGSGDFSISFWIKTADTTCHIAGNRLIAGHAAFWNVKLNGSGAVFMEVDQDAAGTNYALVIGATPINNSMWRHVTAVRNGATVKLYVDGVLDATAAASGPANVSNGNYLILGNTPFVGYPVSQRTSGALDEMRIYNRVLNPAEIAVLSQPTGISDLSGNRLDGEFTGAFPSGNGTPGGDFVVQFTLNTAPPSVAATSPADGATSVNIFAPIVLTFSEGMNRPSAEAAFSISPPTAGSLQWSGYDMIFTPSSPLLESTPYTMTLAASAQDSTGTPMAAPFSFSFTTGTLAESGTALPAGRIRTMLHLGANESDRITGYPTSGQSILWDFFTFAGIGPQHLQQPKAGQTVDLRLAVNNSAATALTWTALTEADGDGMWIENAGDQYVAYFAIYIFAPSARTARLRVEVDDDASAWLDGNPTPLFDARGAGTYNYDFSLSAGLHAFVFKFGERNGNDAIGLTFLHPDNTDMTDLRYFLNDPIAPRVAGILPADGAAAVPLLSDIVVTFSEVMDTSVDPNTAASISNSPAGSWSWSSRNTLMFMPSAPLAPNTSYDVIVNPANARDITGNALAGNNAFAFTTAPVSVPTLATVNPSSGSQGSVNCALAGTNFLQGNVIHPPDSVPFQGHFYRYVNQMTNWHSARDLSLAAGGHLAVPSTMAEDRYIWELGGFTNNWFGLTDAAQEGVYTWLSGEPFVYTNWSPGEPTDWGDEDYGIYWWGFGWNDVGSVPASQRPYVSEFERRAPPAVEFQRAGQPSIVATNVQFVDAGNLSFTINLSGAVSGAWDVVLINPDGGSAMLAGAFVVDTTPPRVTALTPAPDATLTSAPASVVATFSKAVDPATVNTGTVRLVRAGPDATLGTADDVAITPVGVSVTGNQATLDLTGVPLPDDLYQVQLVSGNAATASGLVAYWSFNEGSGTVAADSSGNGRNGTLNGPAWVAGSQGSALHFDGVDDFVAIGVADIAPPWTAALWVKREDSSNDSAHMIGSNANVIKLEQYSFRANVGITKVGLADYNFAYIAPVGQWAHLTFVGNSASSTSLYVNGSFAETISGGIDMPMDKIGWQANAPKGALDEIRMYNRALSAAEIAALANSGISDTGGIALDGEFTGAFPSGNGAPGGDFVATFTLNIPKPPPSISTVDPSTAIQGTMPTVSLSGGNFYQTGGQPAGAQPFGGHYYVYFNTAKSWYEAKAQCESMGGHLPTIATAEENAFIFSLVGGQIAWLGFTDEAVEGQWVWITGEPVTYTNWYPGDPNNFGGGEHYGEMWSNGTWNDQSITINRTFACEFENASLPAVKLTLAGQPDVQAADVRFLNSTSLTFNLDLTGVAPGAWDVVVTNPDGQSATLAGGFTVRPPPQLFSVTPKSADTGTAPALFITGADLPAWSGTVSGQNAPVLIRLKNAGGAVYASGNFTSTATTIDCNEDLAAAAAGVYDLELLENGVVTATLPGAFTVTLPPELNVAANESLPLRFTSPFDGTSPPDKTLSVSNIGGRTLNWTVASDAAWLSATPSSGDTTTETDIVTLHVDTAGLTAAGAPYTATLTFTAPGELGSPVTIAVTLSEPLVVTALSPAPGSTLSAPPATIVATFNHDVDPATVNAGTVRLVRAGADGTLGTADDVAITPAGVSATGNQATLNLAGVPMPDDSYRITINGLDDGALQFDGGDYVRIANFCATAPTNEITVEFWQKTDAATTQASCGTNPGLGTNRIGAHAPWVDGQVYWDFGDISSGGRLVYTPPVSIVGSWQHFAMVASVSGNYMRIYRNGVLEAQKTGATPYVQTPGDFQIGRMETNRYFYGKIDEFRIWNVARTQAEILASLDQPLVGNEPGLVGYWAFNEGTGQTVVDSTGTHNGTLGADALPAADDPLRVALKTPVRDPNGNPLDGEFTGAFPSGDGTPGGDFVSTFRINSSPAAFAGTLSVLEDTPATGTLIATDATNDPLTFSIVSNGAKGKATITNAATGAFSYLPDLNVTGGDSFTFKASDGVSDSNVAVVTVNIAETPPVITSAASANGAVGSAFSYSITASHNPIRFSATGLPAGLAVDAATGVISGAPQTAGNFTASLHATNGAGFSTASLVLLINKGTVTLTWNNPAEIAYPTALSGAQLNATASVPGVFNYSPAAGTVLNPGAQTLSVQFTLDDAFNYNTASKSVTLSVAKPPPPAVTSAPASSPVQPVVGQAAVFSAAATSPAALTYTWNFGDGAIVSGPQNTVTHVFAAAGTYTVVVTVTDSTGQATTTFLSVNIRPAGSASQADSDGDGFSDEMENALGSNASSAASTPFDGAPAGEPHALTVFKLGIKLDFAHGGRDAIKLSGAFAVPAGVALAGQSVVVDVGGVVKTFVLDKRGHSPRSAAAGLKVGIKQLKGAAPEQLAKFSLKLSKGSFRDALADEELTGDADLKDAPREVLVRVLFNKTVFETNLALNYSAKKGKSGVVK